MNATGRLSIIYILNRNWQRCPDGVFKLYCRVTISRQMASIQLPFRIPHEEWDAHQNRVKENSPLAGTVNPYLDALTIKIHFYHDLLSKDTKDILPGMLLEFLRDGQRYSVHTFVWASDLYLKKSKAKVGKQITAETHRRHEVVRDYFLSFLSTRLGVKDIPLSAITPANIEDFYQYLLETGHCNNTAVKHIQTLGGIFRLARDEGAMTKNPIANLDFKMVDVDRGYLSKSELRLLRQTPIGDKSLAMVRDLFVFSCFTGLADSDVRNLTGENIVTDDNGRKWVSYKRQKTKVGAKVLLMPVPLEILGRYWKGGLRKAIFPDMPGNTLLNHRLAKVMELCGIRKKVSFHMARHTFATTVTLSEGVSIESVSKMLGHKNIRTTQIYARITDQRIADEVILLMAKLDGVY